MAAPYFRIVNWREFQHYSDRSPPWIKLHRNLLSSRTWVSLDDEGRTLAIACMLLAADTDNKIPADPAYLQRVAYLRRRPKLQKLADLQFIEFINNEGEPLADASALQADDCSEQSRAEQSRSLSASPTWLIGLKAVYPKRSGDQNWRKAASAGNARLREGHTEDELLEGAKRYAAFVRATGKEGTEFVKQAATFLGPDKSFLEAWTPPPAKPAAPPPKPPPTPEQIAEARRQAMEANRRQREKINLAPVLKRVQA